MWWSTGILIKLKQNLNSVGLGDLVKGKDAKPRASLDVLNNTVYRLPYGKNKPLPPLVFWCLPKERKTKTDINAINPTEETVSNNHNIKCLRPNFHFQKYGRLDTLINHYLKTTKKAE